MENELNDLEKLLALSLLYQLFLRGEISEKEMEKIFQNEKELLMKNKTSFSDFLRNND